MSEAFAWQLVFRWGARAWHPDAHDGVVRFVHCERIDADARGSVGQEAQRQVLHGDVARRGRALLDGEPVRGARARGPAPGASSGLS